MPQLSSAMDQSVSSTLSQVGSWVVVTTRRETRRMMEIIQVLTQGRIRDNDTGHLDRRLRTSGVRLRIRTRSPDRRWKRLEVFASCALLGCTRKVAG
jgi:hypothetical protein